MYAKLTIECETKEDYDKLIEFMSKVNVRESLRSGVSGVPLNSTPEKGLK